MSVSSHQLTCLTALLLSRRIYVHRLSPHQDLDLLTAICATGDNYISTSTGTHVHLVDPFTFDFESL